MYCPTVLCLSVDKLKKTTNKERTMLVYGVYVLYFLSRVEIWEYLQNEFNSENNYIFAPFFFFFEIIRDTVTCLPFYN